MNLQMAASGSLSPAVSNTLRNTYLLLGASLTLSVLTGLASHAMGMTSIFTGTTSVLIMLAVQIGIIFMVSKNANKGAGLFWIMLFAGLEGLILDPMVSISMSTAPGAVTSALAMTAAVTLGMSFMAIVSKKSFSFLRNFLFTGVIILVVGSLINLFIGSSLLSLVIGYV